MNTAAGVFCENYCNCTNEILSGPGKMYTAGGEFTGKMYTAGGEFTGNIDKAGGTGTAEFVSRATEIYCK